MSGTLRKLYGWGLRNNHENVCLRAVLKNRIRSAYKSGEIKVVYDIGAHRGDWSLEWKKILPGAEFFMFEANPHMAQSLRSTGFWYATMPLSDTVKEVDFFTRDGTGDSLYKETSGKYDNPSLSVRTTTARLDDVVRKHGLPSPDFIKIDVQGSEIDILNGGREAFGTARLLLSELPVVEYNEGAPNINMYLTAYADQGFQPVLVGEIHRKAGRLVQLDLLFERFSNTYASSC